MNNQDERTSGGFFDELFDEVIGELLIKVIINVGIGAAIGAVIGFAICGLFDGLVILKVLIIGCSTLLGVAGGLGSLMR